MADKTRPAVNIMLDKERRLLFDLNAMAAFEDATGKSVFSLKAASLGAKDLRALLWSMLLHEDDTLTLKQVGSWITPGNMAGIAEQLTLAFAAAMPESEGKETGPLAGKPPAGSSSGASEGTTSGSPKETSGA